MIRKTYKNEYNSKRAIGKLPTVLLLMIRGKIMSYLVVKNLFRSLRFALYHHKKTLSKKFTKNCKKFSDLLYFNKI